MKVYLRAELSVMLEMTSRSGELKELLPPVVDEENCVALNVFWSGLLELAETPTGQSP